MDSVTTTVSNQLKLATLSKVSMTSNVLMMQPMDGTVVIW
jgi:hypothetical protein